MYESPLVKIPHCWKSHAAAQLLLFSYPTIPQQYYSHCYVCKLQILYVKSAYKLHFNIHKNDYNTVTQMIPYRMSFVKYRFFLKKIKKNTYTPNSVILFKSNSILRSICTIFILTGCCIKLNKPRSLKTAILMLNMYTYFLSLLSY